MFESSSSFAPILPTSQKPSAWAQAPAGRQLEARPIIFKSESMTGLMKVVERVATSSANLLIQGESGTGKELIAQALHLRSGRSGRPFVAINCGAIQESLLESELFGHEKGSFTGAYTKKAGLVEMADGGSLFLDEIAELTPGMQTKLLRFLQEGEFTRVGGTESLRVDVRVLCATNRDLEKEVQEGRFREDLLYRINTIVLKVPALRDRKEDIELLVNYFLSTGAHAHLGRGRTLEAEALKALMQYSWPGNIRELQNTCERLQILSDGQKITLSDLPEQIQKPEDLSDKTDFSPGVTLADLEKKYILAALVHFEGNKTQAAQALGITIKTLYNKLHEYGEFQRFAVHTKV